MNIFTHSTDELHKTRPLAEAPVTQQSLFIVVAMATTAQ